MEIYNERMLTIIDFIVNNNINGVSSTAEFLRTINYPNVDNVYKIKKGLQGFRAEHMLAAQEIYNIDMNYIFNKAHVEMFLQKENKVSTYHRLLEVVHMVGLEINNK